ncbi:uncharacterized protein CEXT_660221 [Caerostris extrusa]|uniref:Uncharacterized protein n=1 Tax=Caerostris extrusa TaxID=172846 RepID=A0AAV4VB74_CAEEX|nr:uncharacterized protein CEXT_660221 [Caerostris extrusa]
MLPRDVLTAFSVLFILSIIPVDGFLLPLLFPVSIKITIHSSHKPTPAPKPDYYFSSVPVYKEVVVKGSPDFSGAGGYKQSYGDGHKYSTSYGDGHLKVYSENPPVKQEYGAEPHHTSYAELKFTAGTYKDKDHHNTDKGTEYISHQQPHYKGTPYQDYEHAEPPKTHYVVEAPKAYKGTNYEGQIPQGHHKGSSYEAQVPQGHYKGSSLSLPQGHYKGSSHEEQVPQGHYKGSSKEQHVPQGHYKGSSQEEHVPQGHYKGSSHEEHVPQGHYKGSSQETHVPQGHYKGSSHEEQVPQGHYKGSSQEEQVPQGHYKGSSHEEHVPQGHYKGSTLSLPQGHYKGSSQEEQVPQGHYKGSSHEEHAPQGHYEGSSYEDQAPQVHYKGTSYEAAPEGYYKETDYRLPPTQKKRKCKKKKIYPKNHSFIKAVSGYQISDHVPPHVQQDIYQSNQKGHVSHVAIPAQVAPGHTYAEIEAAHQAKHAPKAYDSKEYADLGQQQYQQQSDYSQDYLDDSLPAYKYPPTRYVDRSGLVGEIDPTSYAGYGTSFTEIVMLK